MPQAIVDPEELREFARVLKKFNGELRDRASSLGDRLSALNATWRDQEHRKFADAFDEHMRMLERFAEASDQYVPYLLRKADHIENYLQS
jgi:uncharacterized protein YukE